MGSQVKQCPIALALMILLHAGCVDERARPSSSQVPSPITTPIPSVSQTPSAVEPLPKHELEQPSSSPLPVDADQTEDAVDLVDNVERSKVMLVVHGDWIQVASLKDRMRAKHVRLRGIDAPESGQQFFKESRNFLSNLIRDQDVEIHWLEQDHSSAMISDVYLGDKWVNLQMVSEGWAWYDPSRVENDELSAAQEDAKRSKRGLWSNPHSIPPWEYRTKHQQQEKQAFAKAADSKERKRAIDAEKASQASVRQYEVADTSDSGYSSSGGTVHVRGHYRHTKSGKSVWVKPHSRRK